MSPSANASARRKGADFERDVAAYLREMGWTDARRDIRHGLHADEGDIRGVDELTVELKNHAQITNLSVWLDEMVLERDGAGTEHGLLIVKRRGRSIADSYAIDTLHGYLELYREAHPGRP